MKTINRAETTDKLIEQYSTGPVRFAGTDEALYGRHLLFDSVTDVTSAGARDWFGAIARSVRDVLSQRLILTEQTYQQVNPKRVYYLSIEFLPGRSLANNVQNLLLDPVVTQLIKEKRIDWLDALEEELALDSAMADSVAQFPPADVRCIRFQTPAFIASKKPQMCSWRLLIYVTNMSKYDDIVINNVSVMEKMTMRRLLHMKKLSLLLMAIVIAACSEAVAMDAPTSKIVITSGGSIPGHSQYVTLGKVRTHCMENSRASHITAADVIADGALQQSAYRAYGSQVDAIVEANVLFVRHSTLVNPLFDAEGHFECEGTAIHFTGEPAGQ